MAEYSKMKEQNVREITKKINDAAVLTSKTDPATSALITSAKKYQKQGPFFKFIFQAKSWHRKQKKDYLK